jgi:metal-responsive CopG/Arc/MetJ family transcriptional regulator
VTPAGRPAVGAPINIRLGSDLLSRVDAFAAREEIARAEAIRQLVAAGLKKLT